MRDLIGLIDAICDTYDDSALAATPEGVTFCNVAVARVAQAMGCADLTGKTADEMIAYLNDSQDWAALPFDHAQETANVGTLIVAGLDSKDLGQSHGHVVVIRPGKACYSGKWGFTPRVLNIGAENFLARAKRGPLTNQPAGLNESFQTQPKFWAWRPSL